MTDASWCQCSRRTSSRLGIAACARLVHPGCGLPFGRLAWTLAVLVAVLVSPRLAHSQVCSWGGVPSLPPPDAVALRSISEGLRAPSRVAIAGSESLYTTDPATGFVMVTDSFGGIIAAHHDSWTPVAIAVDNDGVVLVGDQSHGRVALYDPSWQQVGELGQGAGEFSLPTDIAIDPALHHVYVSDGGAHEVRVYQADGTLIRTIGGHGTAPGQFDFPAGVFVSVAGELFVADQNNDRVQVFNRDGVFLRCFGNQEDGDRKFGRIQGLTGDALGRLYVSDAFQGQVRVFDPLGVELSTIGSFGEHAGQLRTPSDAAIDDNNRLYVASANTGRVEVFGIDDFVDPPPGPELFSDGFEAGDTNAWSSSNP